MCDSLVSTREFWPRIAQIFGLDASGKNITSFSLVVGMPFPVVRLEMLVSAGEALDLERVLADYELHLKSPGAGETVPHVSAAPAQQRVE